MRSLTFGDRTISYDVGLNNIGEDHPFAILEDDSGTGSVCSEYQEEMEVERERVKKRIQPDILAMTKLLNFNEDDEDGLSDNESDETAVQNSSTWQKNIMKDLSLLPASLPSLSRRHSVCLCQTSLHGVSPWGEAMQGKTRDGSREERKKSTTLSLKLEEVKHIRSVLSKARLEALPLEESLQEAAKDGRVCFLCLKTKFGMFRRGVACCMCCHLMCSSCIHTMRIPSDQFTATPVLLLCPGQSSSGTAGTNCAGSAPTSPASQRRSEQSTNSRTMESSPPPASLPPDMDKYATLPRKTARRWSMVTGQTGEREKMEGCPLTVCTHCKEMVLQVIRTGRKEKTSQQKCTGFAENISSAWSQGRT